jgi:predicted metal-dependent phosphoesterase TrpH
MKIRADLQLHTLCSDGSSDGDAVVRRALIKGLRAVAPTDHNTFRGYYIVKKAVDKINADLLVIPGNEVKTDLGELIILCYEPHNDEKIPKRAFELIDYAHENNCIVYAPHPYDPMRLGVRDNINRLRIDAVEVFNASAPPWSNKKALKKALELGLPMLANSDAHVPEFIGSAHNIINVDEISIEEVFRNIKMKNVWPVAKRPSIYAYIKDLFHSIRLKISNVDRSLCYESIF